MLEPIPINNAEHGHRRTKPLRIGGVMRCCIKTLDESEHLREVEGEILKCKWCSSSLRFRAGAWEWNRD